MSAIQKDEPAILPDEFKDAFNEGAPAAEHTSDDDAMGISTPAEETAVEEAESQETNAEASNTDDVNSKSVQNADPLEPAKEPVEEDEDADLSPKDLQRKKSQEGRMRKMEADLKSLSEQGKARELSEAVVAAEGKADGDDKQAAEEIVEGLQDGSLSAEAAMKQLTEDFGEDFVKMVSAVVAKTAADIAGKTVTERVQKVSDEVKQITSNIADEGERRHFETITDGFPDFYDAVKSPAFQTYMESANDATKQVASKGSAKQVIAMMKAFEASTKPAAPVAAKTETKKSAVREDPAMAAAEGVRSGATRLPDQPNTAGKDDFEGAWAEAAKQA